MYRVSRIRICWMRRARLNGIDRSPCEVAYIKNWIFYYEKVNKFV